MENYTKNIYIVGSPDNVEVVKFMADMVKNQLKGLFSKAWKSYSGPEKKGAFRRGYYAGAVNVIHRRLMDMEMDQMRDPGIKGLVLSNKEALKKFVADEIGNIHNGKGRKLKGSAGAAYGVRDGNKVGINKGIDKQAQAESKMLK